MIVALEVIIFRTDREHKGSAYTKYDEDLCSNPIWLFNDMIVYLQIFIFFVFVKHVDKQSKREIQEGRAIGYDSDFGLYEKRLKNLWLMTTIYMLYATFMTIYDVVRYIWIHIDSQ